jgi:hypothetical protein
MRSSQLPVPTIHTKAPQIAAPLDAKAVLAHYRPPYTLVSDMLFAAALIPTAPLQRHFPGAPLLSVTGRTPLGMWFSRVKRMHYQDENGEEVCQGSNETVVYHELTLIALLRRRAILAPAIYASGSLTILLGRFHYGMPKHPVQMSMVVEDHHLKSTVLDGAHKTVVSAHWQGSGAAAMKVAKQIEGLWSWPAIFPDGRALEVEILQTPQIHPAQVRGSLALAAGWLPDPASLLPWGLYVPDLCMRLPTPESR